MTVDNPKKLAPQRHQPTLYHDLLTPEETQAIRQEVRGFAGEHVAPVAWESGSREESVDRFPRELFREKASAGLFRILVGLSASGRGLRYPATATATLVEELAYHSNSVAAVVDVRCILAGHTLEHPSTQLQGRYLTPLLAGEKIGSFAITEPDASTDLNVQVMQAFAHGDATADYVINGRMGDEKWLVAISTLLNLPLENHVH